MLEDLLIKDFALIESLSIEFNQGFTILSGETGAGKSILIGAVTFLLGGKGGVEQIRAGSHEAVVSGTFFVPPENKAANDWLSEHSIESENNRVMMRRIVRDNGKTSSWIQNTPVVRTELADFSASLVDIHGQHEHQSLMHVPEHRRFLDSYAGITTDVELFTDLYTQLVEKRRELDELNAAETGRDQKIDMLKFAIDEITSAKLKPLEDEELEAEETRLSQFEKLYDDVDTASALLVGSDSNDGGREGSGNEPSSVVIALKRIRVCVDHAAAVDKTLETLSHRLETSFYELSDIAEELRSYKQSLVFDPARLEQVQERSALIYKLKKKYASSVSSPVADVITYCENAQKELDILSASEVSKASLQESISTLERAVYSKATILSQKRRAASDKMSADVAKILMLLGMKGTQFSVALTVKDTTDNWQKCGPYGFDNVEFLISANPGSPLKPLAKIASGGELSRVMLALKTVLSESDTVDTLVFDEIDTGIGGEVAVAVGSHMKKLAQKKQILCITHLASIAVYADTQIKIEKGVVDGNTSTHVHPVEGDERVQEIARMLSGDTDSVASLEHARSLLERFGG